ncbi:MAG: VTC domain-containing protein [Verrucomicrobia bacterium]|nr:VTC domain-containing protein [Verrucomicrobiota bacterium]
MSTTDSQYRYERKFVVQGLSLREVEAGVKSNPALFRTEFPERAVNNIYFDSFNLRHYFGNLDGLRDRTKVRIRWYGPLFGRVEKPVLELKIKHGLLGRKAAYPLPSFQLAEDYAPPLLNGDGLARALPEELKPHLTGLEPTLLNRYLRHYYRSADRRFRLTIDFGLEFYGVRRHQHGFVRRAGRPHLIVLELKYSGSDPEFADRVTGAMPFRLTRMSKYVVGVEAVHDH